MFTPIVHLHCSLRTCSAPELKEKQKNDLKNAQDQESLASLGAFQKDRDAWIAENGAVTKELLGYGHGKSYYNRGGLQMQFHEAFANLTTCYSHKNPIYWEYILNYFPLHNLCLV